MKISKVIAITMCGILVSGVAFAQKKSGSKKSQEKSVEESYLSNIEDLIITELASSPEYDNKQVALQYLEEAVNDGRTSPDVVAALESLAGEGVTTQSRTNGRITNNYPDIRAKACDLLGQVSSEEAKNTLMTIAQDDKEPMVVSAAVRSLGNIGMNDDNEVINMISFIERKYSALNPTSSLALEILVAYEKLAPSIDDPADKRVMLESISNIAGNYKFVTPVRTKARELLKSLQSGSSSSNAEAEK